MSQINRDTEGEWYRQAQKKIDQLSVHGWKCWSRTGPSGREEWRLGEELDKNGVFYRLYSTCTANALPRKLLKSLETWEEEDKQFSVRNMQMALCYRLRRKGYRGHN